MTKRLTIKDMQNKAGERGGFCRSTAYLGQNVDLKWECAFGHSWNASPGNICKSNGTWCPYCKAPRGERLCRAYLEAILGRKFPKVRPLWLKTEKGSRMELDGYCEEIGVAFEHQGYQHYQKAHYSKTDDKLKAIIARDEAKLRLCKENGVILIVVPEVGSLLKADKLKGFLLKELAKNSIDTSKDVEIIIDWKQIYSSKDVESFDKLKNMIGSKEGELLSTVFLGLKEKYLIKCKEGHTWKASGEDIVHGNQTWCGICSKRVKHGIAKLQRIAAEKGGRFLSKRYFNALRKYEWECSEKHTWKTTASNVINKGYWCPDCAIIASKSKCCKPIICLETGIVYKSAAAAAIDLAISRSSITNVVLGKKDTARGLHFKFYKK